MFTANTISRRSRRAAAQLRIIMLATIWAPLSCQSSLVDASFLESGEQVDLLESALYDTPSWLLADFLFTFPFAGDGYLRASEYPLLQRFTPTAGLLQYSGFENDGNELKSPHNVVNASVSVTLNLEDTKDNQCQQCSSQDCSKLKKELIYSGSALFDLREGTVQHIVRYSNREDYVGKTLMRGLSYYGNVSRLLLTPNEKILGIKFALLWKPSK